MPQKKSEAVPEGNGPILQQEEFGSGQPTMEDVYRMMKEAFDRWDGKLDEISDKMEEYIEERRSIDQRLTRLEHGARQLRLAMEADGPANTKTRVRTEGAATAVQTIHGDSCTAQKVQDEPKTSISFGVKAEPPDLPYRDGVLIEDGAAAPKSCLPSLEMRSPTVAGGLVPTGKIFKATETTVNEPLFQFYSTKEENSKKKKIWTSISSAWYDSSFCKLLAALPALRVIETKPMQNMTFDPGGCQGHLRACPVLGSWRALACGEVMCAGAASDELQRFFGGDSLALRSKAGFDAGPGKSLAVEGGSRLHELDGRTELTSSMTAQECQRERSSRSVMQ